MIFGDVALTMIKMMGHTPTVPGAILTEDVPLALEKLRAAVRKKRRLHPQLRMSIKMRIREW